MNYKDTIPISNKIKRFIWNFIHTIFILPFPNNSGRIWIIFLHKIFGAKLHETVNIYSSAKVYAPWNLEMHKHSCLGPQVDCYNVTKITIGAYVTVSQKSYLCTASHDITNKDFLLVCKPIVLKEKSWIGASSFIGMGVTVGEGAVVGATSSVYKDIEKWTVVGGNPAKYLKNREINDE